MSYLDLTRLNFKGYFQADVSTINNSVRNYEIANTKAPTTNTGWNPVGTGTFRLLNCAITGGSIDGVPVTAPDPGIGVTLENAAMRVAGKMVDLDPQQQMVSQIWGMKVRLAIGANMTVLNGEYLPAPFINLWTRQQTSLDSDQPSGAVYQSILHNVNWKALGESALLKAMQAASPLGYLSMNMNVFGFSYTTDTTNPRFAMGQVFGSIGPYHPDEPKHFVAGRQMISNQSEVFNDFTCLDHPHRHMITADLGNALIMTDASGSLAASNDLSLAVYKTPSPGILTSVTPDQVEIIGTITQTQYMQPNWLGQTAGILDFDYSANAWLVSNIGTHSLLLLTPQTDSAGNPGYAVQVQESLNGLYVRADNFVFRLNPGESTEAELIATQYGARLANSAITIQGTPTARPGFKPPTAGAVSMPATVTTNHQGKALLKISAAATGPGNPRGYIDGQVYEIDYQLSNLPTGYVSNDWNTISLLAFDLTTIPAAPTWYQDIQPILTQYGNLYPIMGKHLVDLGNYASVVQHLAILKLAFSLPIEDPNHMPVTRDLSANKRAMILKWIDHPGADGLPLLGTPPLVQTASAAAPQAPEHGDGVNGKVIPMDKIIARRNAERSKP